MKDDNQNDDKGLAISMAMTITCYPVFFALTFVGIFFPKEVTSIIFPWIPIIWQVISCCFAAAYLERNPDKKKQGGMGLTLAFLVLIISAAALL